MYDRVLQEHELVLNGDYIQFWKSDTTVTNANFNLHDWKSPGWSDKGSANDWGVYNNTKDSATFANSSTADRAKMQGPCASGYHVPTRKEWVDAHSAGWWWSNGTNMMNALYLPKAWQKDLTSSMSEEWSTWYYRSSSPNGSYSHILSIKSSGISLDDEKSLRYFTWSVRCFKDN